jgi:CHAD domain-containing protein
MTPEKKFERELEIFRKEAAQAAQFYFSFLAIHAAAGTKRSVHYLLNQAPLFWNTVLGALQTATFIVLGRIFDQQSAHNLDQLLITAQKNREIFSRSRLRARKAASGGLSEVQLNDYVSGAHDLTVDDIRRLRKNVKQWRGTYERKYRDLRRKIFAHREISDAEEIKALFGKTNIRELERLVERLNALQEALWQTFFNGRKPVLRRGRLSVKEMLKRSNDPGDSVQERIVAETALFLFESAGSPNNRGNGKPPKRMRRAKNR